jgi:hypothetical protein
MRTSQKLVAVIVVVVVGGGGGGLCGWDWKCCLL